MPAIGIDPRTGQLIVLPGGGEGFSRRGSQWGPSARAQEEARQREQWDRSDISWIKSLVEGYWAARERARRQAERELATSLALQNPYTAMAFAETGISPSLALENPAAFSTIAMIAFKKYQDDVKRAWQEGKGPIRPLTAKEFLQDLLDKMGWGNDYYIAALEGPYVGLVSVSGSPLAVSEGYGLFSIVEGAGLPQWDVTHKRFFSWATDDAWWLGDPDYLARNPAAARGYGKVSEAPPGWEKVGDKVYRDPTTGFLYFSETGAYLGHGFLSTWQQSSGFLGAPVTNEFSKDGKVYQVFQNGVLSWDPSTLEIRQYRSLEEAGLRAEDVIRSSPLYWTSSGQAISQKDLSSGGLQKIWTEDPYLGKGSSYYDSNPAEQVLPGSAPSSYPYYDIPGDSIQVNSKAVWVQTPSGQFQEPDYWIRSQFMSRIRTNPELKNWYYSLSDLDKNKVFANYIATGQIYL
jgi:hypothetical protein